MASILSFFESTVTGLDLGTHAAKIVELRSSPRGVEIKRVAEFLFDRKASTEENQAELRSFLSREGFSLEGVITAMPGHRLTQRHLRFPFIGKQVAAAVPLALDEELPIPLDGMVLTQESLTQRQPTERTDVLAILTPVEEVREHLAFVQGFGCDPCVVEVEGSVLANALAFLGWNDSPRLVLNIGHRQTNVALVARGKPLMIRSIPVAGQHFTDALTSELSLAPEAAEKQKHENGVFRPGTTTPVAPRVGALLDQLARETLRSVQALVSDALDPEAPTEILLVGGSAILPQLSEYLTERTRLPCRSIRSLPEVTGIGPLATEPNPERFIQALALALRGSSAAVTRSDFRQGEFRYTADFSALGRELTRATALFGVLLLLWPISQAMELWSVHLRLGRIQDRVGELYVEALPGTAVPADPMGALQSRLQETEELANHLGVTGAGASPLELLREVSARIPPDLDIALEEVRLERYSIRARGLAPDFNSVDRMREELSKVPLFRQVAVSNVGSVRQQEGKRFELTIELERQL